jgi:hypothetical protein
LDEARLRRNEYSELLAELTAEIEACLEVAGRRGMDEPGGR